MLQRKLRFYFMSPIDKWRLKKRFPLKLLFQLVKIILVTAQILSFGNEMSDYLTYEDNTRTAFREMLLSGWDPTREVFTYPPSTGSFAIYTSTSFYQSVDYAIQQYSNLSTESVGAFGYDTGGSQSSDGNKYPVVLFEQTFYRQRFIDPSRYIFNFNDQRVTREAVLSGWAPAGDPRWLTFRSAEYFRSVNFTVNFETLISFKVRFPLRTIYYTGSTLRCYDLNITIWYDNSDHDGEIPIDLSTERRVHQCKSADVDGRAVPSVLNAENDSSSSSQNIIIAVQSMAALNWSLALNWLVILFCTLSTVLCVRSVYRGQLLRAETERFFTTALELPRFSFGEAMEFLDLWIIMIAVNDVLIVCGTLLKIKLETEDIISGTVFTDASLMLGVGNLLVWLGLLRYLSYFSSYNILILTVRKSMPNILRFLLCAVLIYSGFCFCGWIILGPYHLKFRTLSSTSECLFSLMNGDDMFATFFSTNVKAHSIIWWFSRIYFYLFISLAIYVIVSLFIAIILDSYESIRDYYAKSGPEDGWLKSPLQKFIEEHPIEDVDGASFSNNSIVDHLYRHVARWFTCTRR